MLKNIVLVPQVVPESLALPINHLKRSKQQLQLSPTLTQQLPMLMNIVLVPQVVPEALALPINHLKKSKQQLQLSPTPKVIIILQV